MHHKFKLESIYLDLKKRKLVVNGRELPFSHITDFLLESHDKTSPEWNYPSGYWKMEIKRNIVWDAAEICAPSDGKAGNVTYQADLEADS